MHTYKITWTPRSPLSTPLQSDTIFGHLCWAVTYLWGQESLIALLGKLRENPCLVLSSAFPAGMLPIPDIPVRNKLLDQIKMKLGSDEDLRGWIKQNALEHPSDLDYAIVQKQIRKDKWLAIADLAQSGFVYDVQVSLFKRAYKKMQDLLMQKSKRSHELPKSKDEVRSIEFHNMIDRQTGTTSGSGELFASPTTFFHNRCFESWLSTDVYDLTKLQDLFSYIAVHGFGKDKNTGKGRFEIKVDEFSWPSCPGFNAYLNLSNMVPATSDSILASYRGQTKFGKIGGDFATTATPFKYPVFVIEPGAVFFAGEGQQPPRGSLLDKIHPNPDIVQNLYCYSLPIMIKES
ncbi:MAG TPA: hypothetical protein PL188_08205 [Candidatus Cloacimonadota bacterium]|nr:hypothetical protein [Candidatus Cloacimonadota bacterium]